jgi:hypothetical protein
MGKLPDITSNHDCAKCNWRGDQTGFENDCPILLHSLYPYFLGLLYKADMQNIWVCCPAEHGIDVLIRRETNNGQFPDVPNDWWVIYAEVVKVNGDCDYEYILGEKILFPTCYKKEFICPAGVNNIFPFLDIEVPKCINKKKLRCPDWKDTVYYEIK